jgi:hypothetical protein
MDIYIYIFFTFRNENAIILLNKVEKKIPHPQNLFQKKLKNRKTTEAKLLLLLLHSLTLSLYTFPTEHALMKNTCLVIYNSMWPKVMAHVKKIPI